jgi:hypothetical protein
MLRSRGVRGRIFSATRRGGSPKQTFGARVFVDIRPVDAEAVAYLPVFALQGYWQAPRACDKACTAGHHSQMVTTKHDSYLSFSID